MTYDAKLQLVPPINVACTNSLNIRIQSMFAQSKYLHFHNKSLFLILLLVCHSSCFILFRSLFTAFFSHRFYLIPISFERISLIQQQHSISSSVIINLSFVFLMVRFSFFFSPIQFSIFEIEILSSMKRTCIHGFTLRALHSIQLILNIKHSSNYQRSQSFDAHVINSLLDKK